MPAYPEFGSPTCRVGFASEGVRSEPIQTTKIQGAIQTSHEKKSCRSHQSSRRGGRGAGIPDSRRGANISLLTCTKAQRLGPVLSSVTTPMVIFGGRIVQVHCAGTNLEHSYDFFISSAPLPRSTPLGSAFDFPGCGC